MNKFDEAIQLYLSQFSEKLGRKDIDEDLLRAIAKSLGPSLYQNDASKVACSSKKEKSKIRTSFLVKKLGLEDDPSLDEAIEIVCDQMGRSNRNKYRAMFYYLLVEHFDKQSVFISKTTSTDTTGEKVDSDPAEASEIDTIIRKHALYAAGAGLIPIPVVDLVSISAVQYKMIKKIALKFDHVVFDEEKAKSVIAALMGGLGSFELGLFTRIIFKGIPVIGPVVGGTAVSGFAYGSTMLIGRIFEDHFTDGGDLTIEEITLQKMKEVFSCEIERMKGAFQ